MIYACVKHMVPADCAASAHHVFTADLHIITCSCYYRYFFIFFFFSSHTPKRLKLIVRV